MMNHYISRISYTLPAFLLEIISLVSEPGTKAQSPNPLLDFKSVLYPQLRSAGSLGPRTTWCDLRLLRICIRVIRGVAAFLSERDVELSSRLGHLLDLVSLFTSCLRFYSLSSAPLSMWRQKFMAKAALKRQREGTRRTMRTKSKQGTVHVQHTRGKWNLIRERDAGSCCFHGTTYMLFITILNHCWISGIALFSGVKWNRQTGMHLQILGMLTPSTSYHPSP